MAEVEGSKDLISVLWSGADILRSKMDANEYKDYLLGIVFYKYLSDTFLIKVYDLIYDEKPKSLKVALDAYKEALEDESAEPITCIPNDADTNLNGIIVLLFIIFAAVCIGGANAIMAVALLDCARHSRSSGCRLGSPDIRTLSACVLPVYVSALLLPL